MAVLLGDNKLQLEQVYRFDSPPIEQDTSLFWDIGQIWNEIMLGLRKAAEQYGDAIRSIGVDSWGVDYAWFDKNGELLRLPHCYRDARTSGVMEEITERLGRQFIFAETGIQFMRINTLYQLCADLGEDPWVVNQADHFLMIADAINYWLSGKKACERTNASTTQLYDPQARDWCHELSDRVGLPSSIFPKLVDPGVTLGSLKSNVADETGLADVSVIAVGSHDTASAVAGVPAATDSFAYLSCGTWALLGTEVAEPIISEVPLEHNFTNETGVGGAFRLLKNITGLWILQECRRVWQETDQRVISYQELTDLEEDAESLTAFIDPDDPIFGTRGNHPEAVQRFCEKSDQPVPTTRGQVLRVATESLALKVATVLQQLEALLGTSLDVLHVIGGGVHNAALMQGISNATERKVIAGPAEATAMGNALVQMMAAGEVASLDQGRALLANTIETTTYEPCESWDNARQRFRSLLNSHAISTDNDS